MSDPVAQSTISWEACQDQCRYLVKKWLSGTTSGRPPDRQKKRMEKYWKQSSNIDEETLQTPVSQSCMQFDKVSKFVVNDDPAFPRATFDEQRGDGRTKIKTLKINRHNQHGQTQSYRPTNAKRIQNS